MRVAIVKPDWGITGGLEVVIGRIARELETRGHRVIWHTVDVGSVPGDPFGVPVADPVRGRAWEAFRYFGLVERFRALDVSGADLVISTQPPSFVVDHPHQLALFYHHLRLYYDLSDAYVRSGFTDARDHASAQDAVREVDGVFLPRVTHFLAGSNEVAGRLREYQGLTQPVSIFHAGRGREGDRGAGEAARWFDSSSAATEGSSGVLCVSRHEWPKRTELFVHAMKHLPALSGWSVGTGGRLAYVRALDARLTASHAGHGDVRGRFDCADAMDEALWLTRGDPPAGAPSGGRSNVEFLGYVSDEELARRYRAASCVVAPAFREDYGLTAIEAMAYAKPVIVCDDGGGLTDFVRDGVDGFVVAPTGPALACAVERLVGDRDLARAMGEAARERAGEFTWPRAWGELEHGIEQALS